MEVVSSSSQTSRVCRMIASSRNLVLDARLQASRRTNDGGDVSGSRIGAGKNHPADPGRKLRGAPRNVGRVTKSLEGVDSRIVECISPPVLVQDAFLSSEVKNSANEMLKFSRRGAGSVENTCRHGRVTREQVLRSRLVCCTESPPQVMVTNRRSASVDVLGLVPERGASR
jgi:hypothetical protein